MKHTTNSSSKQQGLVSIVVTVTIMFILSILVIGFSRVTRREQVQILDRQLNTQAFYAAESGVNAAVSKMNNPPSPIPTGVDENKCTGTDSFMDKYLINNVLSDTVDADGRDVRFSCLIVDKSPTTLEYGNIGQTASKVFPIRPTSGNVNTIEVYWEGSSGGTNITGCRTDNRFPSSWHTNCDIGVLRIDLVQTSGTFDMDDLVERTRTVFLYPGSNPGASTSAPAGFPSSPSDTNSQGEIITGDCSGGGHRHCKVTLDVPDSPEYTMRIKSIYRDSSVVITANDSGGAGGVELADAQALIDSTGKAVDVLRRIQVRVSLRDNVITAESALESSGTICKQFGVAPPNIVYRADSSPECDPEAVAGGASPVIPSSDPADTDDDDTPPEEDEEDTDDGGTGGGGGGLIGDIVCVATLTLICP